jgi:Tol biopolymer transport system component
VERGLRTRFTFDPAEERVSTWSPDATRLIFNSSRKGHLDLYEKAASGSGTEEVLLADNSDKNPSWSPDGRFIIYGVTGNGADQFVLPLSGDHKPAPFLHGQFNENVGQFSPDGRWVVYRSDEAGTAEIYVAPFPGPDGKWQISNGGGNYPRWRSDGTEIFYLAPDNKLMAAAVNGKGASFEVGAVKPLFDTRARLMRYPYDVSPDGQRFLINTFPEQVARPISVVLNWTAGLKK